MQKRSLRIHYLQHVPFEGPGYIESWAMVRGHRLTSTRLYAGQRLPAAEELDWLVILGGPMNVYEENRYPWLAREKRFIGEALHGGKVVIGICLGAQLLASVLGAKVTRNPCVEIGWYPVEKAAKASQSISPAFFRIGFPHSTGTATPSRSRAVPSILPEARPAKTRPLPSATVLPHSSSTSSPRGKAWRASSTTALKILPKVPSFRVLQKCSRIWIVFARSIA